MANRYWVGGSGQWDSSSTTHWSTTSGGGGGASVPTASDDVYIDYSSGTGGNEITISGSVYFRNLRFASNSRAYINSPGTGDHAYVYGTIDNQNTGNAGFNFNGTLHVSYDAGGSNPVILSNLGTDGGARHNIIVDSSKTCGIGTDWKAKSVTLNGISGASANLVISSGRTLKLEYGSFTAPNGYFAFQMDSNSVLDISTGDWHPYYSSYSLTLDASSKIRFSGGTCQFYGYGGLTVPCIEAEAATLLIDPIGGGMTATNLTIKADATVKISTSSYSLTVSALTCNVTQESDRAYLQSGDGVNPAHINGSGNTHTLYYATISHIHATNGTFNARASVDGGGNEGWNFYGAGSSMLALF